MIIFVGNKKRIVMKPIVLFAAAVLALGCAHPQNSNWTPAGDHIRTRWADAVDPGNPLPEYPRPQLVREGWKSLNGLWDYAIVPKEAAQPEVYDGQILVPFCAESSLSGVGRRVTADDALWYHTSFEIPRKWKERVMLNFGAVDWDATIWLNGEEVARHTGGYTAFGVDITPYLKKGAQELIVKVLDATDNDEQPRGKQVSEPGGIWYTPVTGIWQTVWLEPLPQSAITGYTIVPDIEAGAWDVTVQADGGDRVLIGLREGGEGYGTEKKGGALLAQSSVAPGKPVRVRVADPQLWSPEHPYLYALEFTLQEDGKDIDKARSYTALRSSSEVIDKNGRKRLGLNGKPYFQLGPLDQGWWPDGLYTAPTDEARKYDLDQTKALGYNMIRKHIKVEPARWYYWCDRLGIVVWQDMPSITDSRGGHWEQWTWASDADDVPLSESARNTYYKEWGEIIDQLCNEPCIVVWVPFNEAWAQFQTAAAVDFTREKDATRLINSASGGNSFPLGDILDSHNYPDPVMKFWSEGALIDVLGEYGGIGWPVEGHLWQPDRNWGYVQFKSGEEVLARYTEYAEILKETVAQGISGAVYTQTTDVEGEVNGLMTYDRAITKMDPDALRAVNLAIRASACDE